MAGKFIVIEGPDCSGKKTQSELLVEKIGSEGKRAERIAFPDYEGPVGKAIKRYLQGEVELDPYQAGVLFATDRLMSSGEIIRLLKDGVHVVCDRYSASNAAHQAARIESGSLRKDFISWVSEFETTVLGLPEPHFTIILDVESDFQAELLKERSKVQGSDVLEEDLEYQKVVRDTYLSLADENHWDVVQCVKEGTLQPPEAIHAALYGIVKKYL